MRNDASQWHLRVAVLAALAVGVAFVEVACRPERPGSASSESGAPSRTLASAPGVRIGMEDLHRLGGVPPNWKLTPPQGDAGRGRETFERFACYKCHAIQGESFPAPPSGPGPDLTGMGAHHPPGYFVEAILNPNAVLVEGPDYLQADGTSRMPAYPDMTLAELADLVAYLMAAGATEAAHHGHHGSGQADSHSAHTHHDHESAPPAAERLAYLARVYRADDATIDRFYQWFDEQRYAAVPGLVRIETYASRERSAGQHTLLVLLGFENEAALAAFLHSHEQHERGSFLRPAAEMLLESPALYRAIQMSVP